MHKVLVVDDSRTVLMLFKDFLQKSGYEVITASDGENGFQSALADKPSLVILDGIMPRMDGFDVCRRLRSDPQTKSMKIVMLTGGSEEIENQRARDAGADFFLSKKAAAEEIVRVVNRLLHS